MLVKRVISIEQTHMPLFEKQATIFDENGKSILSIRIIDKNKARMYGFKFNCDLLKKKQQNNLACILSSAILDIVLTVQKETKDDIKNSFNNFLSTFNGLQED